ncbi:inhibin alpha chain isoform X1 [Xiphophorus maculatus]|uniref:inhibin alpha chain isoform X1 n=1 Tax=Xiphophorus maculatus TaxID=8083 RepID=UPI000C6EEE91|nr:inhibin alpha chain isoform X1 [Xiphophorus maculatus]
MVSWSVLILGPLWIQGLLQVCGTEKLPRGVVESWFRKRILEGLGLLEPPVLAAQRANRDGAKPETRQWQARVPGTSRVVRVSQQPSPGQDRSEVILFPCPADASWVQADAEARGNCSTTPSYRFQPSIPFQDTVVLSAHFWFYAGPAVNASPLFMLTLAQRRLQAAQAPAALSPDGWTTYDLDQSVLAPMAEGPFLLQLQSSAGQHHLTNPDKTPFLHLHVQPRVPVRSPRAAPVNTPWSPAALRLLQRPSHEELQLGDCHREQVEISFQELGWDSWIVHPKVLTFFYCRGNCSARGRTAVLLGMAQCCAPVPGTMRSLKITTTSDGGYSFKYETLPNIMPEECTCF